MKFRFLFFALLLLGLGTGLSAQSGNPCADLAKKHLATLDEHLDLDYGQMKCLKEVAVRFCTENRANPPANAKQRDARLKTFRQAILNCLDERQQARVKNHFRNAREKKARKNLLQAFLEEFADEVIVLKRKN